MKEAIFSLAVATLVFASVNNANAVADPAVTGATISPSPIVSATGNSFSFQFINNGSGINNGQASNVKVTVSLSRLAMHAGYDLATDITGTGASLFTWTYDASLKVFTGTLNQAVAQFGGGTITINGLVVTAISPQSAPANGANVNVLAPGGLNSSTANDNTNSFTYTSNVGPLAVKLVSFTAAAKGCDAVLSWQTANEDGFNHFTLQSSANGVDFENIADIGGRGSNSTYNYEYRTNGGKLMYRLEMVDDDGSADYSGTAAVNINCNLHNVVQIVPNPVVNTFNLLVSYTQNSGYSGTATVYNATGSAVLKQAVQSGSNNIDMTSLPAGIYSVVLQDNNGAESYKLVKQ